MILNETRIISGRLDDIWNISTDVDNWTTWDPHEEKAKLHGPFVVGTKGYSKPRGGPDAHWVITDVQPRTKWALLNKMPIGSLAVTNTFEAMQDGKVKCGKEMVVSGLILNLLFKLHFAKATRKDMHDTWHALETQAKLKADNLS